MTKDKSAETRRVLLGEVGPAHGIRGEVIIKTFTAEPESISSYGDLEDESGDRKFTIHPVRHSSKGLIARIAGVDDRTAAEKLRGMKLYVARGRLPETNTDEFYHSDLIGLRAIEPSGAPIGSITGVHNFGAGDILEVKFDATGTTEFLPFNGEVFPDVNLIDKTILLVMPAMSEIAEGSDPDRDRDG
jgi:16S rRNA processing protein RimM